MFFKKVCSVLLSISLLFNQIVYAGGITVDSTASSMNKPSLGNAQNGVPIVNIVNPNSNGLSHNKFKNYNVNKQGLILNNSRVVTKTQLAGYIDRNKNLSTTAKVILNEVTGTNKSLLKGYTEVAGSAAHVIIANPNGISVNGGGFINTPQATLTTGKPFFYGNELSGFNVRGGDIIIEGEGFNVNNIDKVNLYSKALQLNAKIYANKLNIVTGDNDISQDGTITSLDTNGSGIAIDSSLLGGIYANTITLTSNDKGVGVNLPPEVISQKDLIINANGNLVLKKVVANENINITISNADIESTNEVGAKNILLKTSKDLIVDAGSIIEASNNLITKAKNINNSGELRAISDNSNLSLEVEQELINNNNIYSKNDIVINSTKVENNNLIQADDDITANITDFTNNTNGTIYAKDKLTLISTDIDNKGVVTADNVDIKTQTITNKGAVYTTNDMSIKANTLTNEEMIRSNNEINLLISNALNNEKTSMIYADGNINITANEDKDKINTVTNKGLIQSHKDINITAKTLNNTAAAPRYTPKTTSSTKTVSRGGSKSYDIVTTTISTDVLTIPTDPALMLAEGNITIDVDTLNNYYSLISSDKDIILNALTANNVGKVAITTTSITTKQYRKEKYCSKRVSGSCMKHKTRAGYRGTFTSKSTSKVPVINYGIQAKRSIIGNVVTLNNINNGQDILTQQEISQKQDEINTVVSNSINLQNGITALDDNNEQINLIVNEVQDMEAKVDSIQTNDDFTTFKIDLQNIKTALEDVITKDKETMDNLQVVINYAKTLKSSTDLEQEIIKLESSLSTLKDNLTQNTTNLENIENIDSSLNVVEDMAEQKQALIDVDVDIKNIIENNHTIIGEIENNNLSTLINEFDKVYNTLSDELQNTLTKQENTKQTVISNQNGLYQTRNTPTLKTVSNITINKDSSDLTSKLTLPKNKFGLFTLSENPKHSYLIEANPLYTNYQTFISSDYMMGKLGYDPTKTIKRLGDAMYETTLIRNSIINLSGQRYLKGYDSDLAQFKGLMDNAIEVQKNLNLAFGVTLSKEQINSLTKDIVWMEEKIIQGQKVLVPVVYLASLNKENLKDGSQIIAGEDIALATTGTLQNQGKIEAGNDLAILSNNIQNHGGTIEAKNNAALQSNTNIDNISGAIKAGKDLKLNAKKNINISVATNEKTYKYKKGSQTTTNKGKDSEILAGGNLLINAGEGVNITSSKVKAEEDAVIIADKGDVTIDTAKQKEKFYFDVYGGYYKGDSSKNSGSQIEAKNLTVLTNGNLNISGSTIKVKEDANIYAKDVNIISSQDTSSSKYKSESKGFFSSSSTKIEKQSSKNIASLLQAKNVNIDTDSLTLIASKIKANQAEITAEIINLISSKDSEYLSEFSDTSGILTRTIATKGYIKEIAKEAKIEVNEKLIVNNKDITEKLTSDNIIKTLSSEGKLTHEQINLVKAVLNNDEWDEKTTSLSGLGALIVAVVVTVLTAGAGTAIVGAAGGAAAGTATAATTASVQAAVVQSLVTGVTNQLVTSAITGNSFKLDGKTLLKGAVNAGVLSYANTALSIDALKESMSVTDYTQNAVVRGTAQGITSELTGGEFKDGFKTGAVLSVFNDSSLQMRKYVKDNYDYAGKNGEKIPDNVKSIGVNGDGVKLAGSGLKPDSGEKVIAPFGGAQTGERLIFGIPYTEGGIVDKTVEYFAGPHDFMSSWNYENIDNKTFLKSDDIFINTASGLLLIPSIPFAVAPFIQNNISEINAINSLKKEQKKKLDNIIENYKKNEQFAQENYNENK
ncbi:two-partner secretion domain-containing protein [Halarcobacter bivalviorum]|uniref:two-partner secretion domain-containing protein n=1 Tax=Halarcobacter bivalviorum TaxID=663364 RepID=UPI00100B8DA6|nr:filamentous hemagglutinin N-terminal domain-containing protein [Halarcobacter bivalviorum]RXK05704.1 hypothetical protein CRU97_07265 [Halarcobacter bivalviorum]